MDGIRAWSAAVCIAALGCSAVQLLAPKNSTGKLFRLIATTFFICCMMLPLLRWQSFAELDIGGLPEEVTAKLLEDTVTGQLHKQIKETVTVMAEECLAARGVTAEKIEVTTDTSADGGIYIQQVTITVDKQTVPNAKSAGEVLSEQLGTAVTVEAQ